MATDVLLAHGFTFHELFELLQVFVRVERNAQAFTAVSSGASRLLVIAFETFGNIVMYHESNVGLVNPHAKGNGSHDHVNIFFQERILRIGAHLCIQTGVISTGLDIIGEQNAGEFFHALARKTIDNAAHTRTALDETNHVIVDFLAFRTYFVIKIRAIERAFELHGIGHAETFLDVGAHFCRRRRRECYHRGGTDLVDERANLPIFGSKIMPPLGDTVRFVDGIERDFDRLEKSDIVLLGQLLGSHIE